MKSKEKTRSGKDLNIPTRMLRKPEIERMQISVAENQIFFNKSSQGQEFEKVSDKIKQKMVVVNYPDCSRIPFSVDKLLESIKEQMETDADTLILPYFKDETEFDIAKKLAIADRFKGKINKDIILEISHKVDYVVMKNRIIPASDSFDHLAIFYGVHYGRYPSFSSICKKIILFKMMTKKKVFCTAVPIMFSGEKETNSSHLLPVWSIVCDGWVKNWRSGGGRGELKLVDFEDLINKTFQGWLESGHQTGEMVTYAGTTVFSLFNEGSENDTIRETYKDTLLDEVLNEFSSVTPYTIESLLMEKCPEIYQIPIMRAYNEKIIQSTVNESKWIKIYSPEEAIRIENYFRKPVSPQQVHKEVMHISELVKGDEKIPVATIINEIDKLRKGE